MRDTRPAEEHESVYSDIQGFALISTSFSALNVETVAVDPKLYADSLKDVECLASTN